MLCSYMVYVLHELNQSLVSLEDTVLVCILCKANNVQLMKSRWL